MLHALTMPGGFVGVILYAVTALLSSWKAKYVPWLVRYVTADVPLSVLPETFAWITGAVIPPRLFRFRRYALRSLPRASTSCEGVAPGTSITVALTPPTSVSLLSRLNQLVGAQ